MCSVITNNHREVIRFLYNKGEGWTKPDMKSVIEHCIRVNRIDILEYFIQLRKEVL